MTVSHILPDKYVWQYQIPTIPDLKTYNVGSEVRDIEDKVESVKLREFNERKAEVSKKFEVDTQKYNITLTKLKNDAQPAKNEKTAAVIQLGITIGLIAACILLIGAVITASIITGTLPILFAIAPLVCAIIPGFYYISFFSTQINELNNKIEAPEKLAKPSLGSVPPYSKELDYEYKSSRKRIVKMLARESLDTISEWSIPLLVNFRLLDKSKADQASLEVFYGKALFLIQETSSLKQTYKREVDRIENEVKRALQFIENSRSSEDLHLRLYRWQQLALESARHGATCSLNELNNKFNALRAQINTL